MVFFGIYFGGMGVVVAWVLALAIGSSVTYISCHIKYKISLAELLPKKSRGLMVLCVSSVCFFFLFTDAIKALGLIYLIPAMLIVISMWFHPMRKKLMQWTISIVK